MTIAHETRVQDATRTARPPGALRLLVVVVNYRTAALCIDCLASLASEARELDLTVVVTDNASADGSAERIEAAIRQNGWSWASLRPLPRNGGFSSGNNAAIVPAFAAPAAERPDYVLLLNPDTLVRPGALTALLEFMEARPDVGIAGSRLEDLDGTQQHSRFRFPNALGELEANARLGLVSRLLDRWRVAPPLVPHEHTCDWVAGASMIVRRAVVEQLGPLDEAYFLYYEEVDYCLRAKRAGWQVWYVPSSRVVHLVGRSSGVTGRGPLAQRRPSYWFASRRRYFVANHGRAYALFADLCWLVGRVAWTARRGLQRKPDPDPPRLGRDFVHHNFLRAGGWGAPR